MIWVYMVVLKPVTIVVSHQEKSRAWRCGPFLTGQTGRNPKMEWKIDQTKTFSCLWPLSSRILLDISFYFAGSFFWFYILRSSWYGSIRVSLTIYPLAYNLHRKFYEIIPFRTFFGFFKPLGEFTFVCYNGPARTRNPVIHVIFEIFITW